jgi:hypothetical protein
MIRSTRGNQESKEPGVTIEDGDFHFELTFLRIRVLNR